MDFCFTSLMSANIFFLLQTLSYRSIPRVHENNKVYVLRSCWLIVCTRDSSKLFCHIHFLYWGHNVESRTTKKPDGSVVNMSFIYTVKMFLVACRMKLALPVILTNHSLSAQFNERMSHVVICFGTVPNNVNGILSDQHVIKAIQPDTGSSCASIKFFYWQIDRIRTEDVYRTSLFPLRQREIRAAPKNLETFNYFLRLTHTCAVFYTSCTYVFRVSCIPIGHTAMWIALSHRFYTVQRRCKKFPCAMLRSRSIPCNQFHTAFPLNFIERFPMFFSILFTRGYVTRLCQKKGLQKRYGSTTRRVTSTDEERPSVLLEASREITFFSSSRSYPTVTSCMWEKKRSIKETDLIKNLEDRLKFLRCVNDYGWRLDQVIHREILTSIRKGD